MRRWRIVKKVYKLEDLDCANCAAKMERAIAKIEGVESVRVSFLSQRMTLEAEESKMEEILDQAVKACKRIEPDCKIIRP